MKIDVGHSLGRLRAVVLLSLLSRGQRKSETMQFNGKTEERLVQFCRSPLTHALDLHDSKEKETAHSLLFRLITLSTPLLQLDREWILDAKPRSCISPVGPWH